MGQRARDDLLSPLARVESAWSAVPALSLVRFRGRSPNPPCAWWNNEDDLGSTHSQSRLGWMAAGYTAAVDLASRLVLLTRPGR